MLYDVVIIGAGPAGAAAAVYSARKKLKTLLITESFGGQSIVSNGIENWIGEKNISGFDLAKKFEEHIRSYSNIIDIKTSERALGIRARQDDTAQEYFEITTNKNITYCARTLILAVGARRRKLNIPGEDKFSGKGVVYCSTCDAPLFPDKEVAVVGGGNAGLEAVIDLLPYASKIYLMNRSSELRGDTITQEEIKNNPKVQMLFNIEPKEITGEQFVTGISYLDKNANEQKTLKVEGIFVEIGSIPNSEIVKNLVNMDQWGQVIIDSKHASTSYPGIFAAGDITDDPYKQNNISAGDGVKAALAAYAYIKKRDKQSPASETNHAL